MSLSDWRFIEINICGGRLARNRQRYGAYKQPGKMKNVRKSRAERAPIWQCRCGGSAPATRAADAPEPHETHDALVVVKEKICNGREIQAPLNSSNIP